MLAIERAGLGCNHKFHPSEVAWQANTVAEITFEAAQSHSKPFADVALEVVFTDPAGAQKAVGAFWAGGRQWQVRYSCRVVGIQRYRTPCDEALLHAQCEGEQRLKRKSRAVAFPGW